MNIACKAKSGDGTLIAYRRTGGGPPLILVSGTLGTAETETRLAELLAPRFEVFVYDRRGRGASGDTGPYEVRREIEDLASLLAEAGGSASVYGVSAGAILVLEAAAAGLPITQFALYEPPYPTDPSVLPDRTAFTERLTSLLAQGRRDGAVELFLSMVGTPRDLIAGMRRSPLWPGLTALAHTLAYDNALVGLEPVPQERLAAIGTRGMVVDGGASTRALRTAAKAVATALPRGRHRTLTGQTHEVAPHVLAPVLTEFFTA
ncbi:alpha/beta fold hydrolase [Streptomyces liangshanensis]|uniref:Alpha/beta hydrolase n=1 Tax=Streptomyces liangshanensis TaxID=2717324 RepID=A0A6G9GW83_9ACTN|nr:alpha/beta hydrolase [Streptomyces liangshanensis]QIQ02532.1 alpha/beta hydrolase [Streptomyces liangshanensis]